VIWITSDRSILCDSRSFSITCGVETTTRASFQSAMRFAGGILPVNTMISSGGRVMNFFKNEACCSTSGLVGARIMTLPLILCSRLAMTNMATMVLPRPVGSTTSVDCLSAAAARLSWYNLCSIASGLISKWVIKSIVCLSVSCWDRRVSIWDIVVITTIKRYLFNELQLCTLLRTLPEKIASSILLFNLLAEVT